MIQGYDLERVSVPKFVQSRTAKNDNVVKHTISIYKTFSVVDKHPDVRAQPCAIDPADP